MLITEFEKKLKTSGNLLICDPMFFKENYFKEHFFLENTIDSFEDVCFSNGKSGLGYIVKTPNEYVDLSILSHESEGVVAEILIKFSDEEFNSDLSFLLGYIAIDSSTIMLSDFQNLYKNHDFKNSLISDFEGNFSSCFTNKIESIHSSTGDGVYPIYSYENEKGDIIGLNIVFLDIEAD